MKGDRVEETAVQLGGPMRGAIIPAVQQAAGELVDFRLRLQLEQRDSPSLADSVHDVQEVGDALGHLAVSGEILFQALGHLHRGQLAEALQQLRRQVESEPKLVALLMD